MEITEQTKVINVYKKVGQTPLEVINLLKSKYDFLNRTKLAYAGRLDPLASGILLILVGDECKNRDHYQNLEKTYEFECLFGISTDTFDTLGLIDIPNAIDTQTMIEGSIDYINLLNSIKSQSYPPYSSFHINGHPLFYWAKLGKLDELEIPKKDMQVKEIKILDKFILASSEVLYTSIERIDNVKGDFRQEEIKKDWIAKLDGNDLKFSVIKFSATVNSGTYIRSLCKELGNLLKVPALALNITRTKVADFKIEDSIKL